MAKHVTAVQLGAQPKEFNDVETVKEIMDAFGLTNVTIKVNGQTVDPDFELEDYAYVSFGEKIKGGVR